MILARAIVALALLIAPFAPATLADSPSPLVPVSSFEMLAHIAVWGGDVTAYSLQPDGALVRALALACATGHHAVVTLDKPSFDRAIIRENGEVMARLSRCTTGWSRRSIHLKTVVSGGSTYLSDTNFGANALVISAQNASVRSLIARTIVAARTGTTPDTRAVETDSWAFASVKKTALALEYLGLEQSGSGEIDVATESFGDSPFAKALYTLASRGRPVRLIVARRESQQDSAERRVLDVLRNVGVQVRFDTTNEKEMLDDRTCWVGSANATVGPPQVQTQPDWGFLVSRTDRLCALLQERFQATWNGSTTYDQ